MDETSKVAERFAKGLTISENVLRGILALLVIFQVHILVRADMTPCFAEGASLHSESNWMATLCFFQALFVVMFTIWRYRLNSFESIMTAVKHERDNAKLVI